jgi:ssDNA-binding Zn-finger/Zn-ribbon topoisomerase 1
MKKIMENNEKEKKKPIKYKCKKCGTEQVVYFIGNEVLEYVECGECRQKTSKLVQ